MDIGQKVKLIFYNGVIEEGIIQEWTKERATLKSLNGRSLLYIFKPEENILGVKVVLDETIEKEESEPIYEEIKEEQYQALTHNDRIKKLAELRKEAAQVERERVKKQMTSFRFSGSLPDMITEDNYGTLPRKFFVQGSPSSNTPKKDR